MSTSSEKPERMQRKERGSMFWLRVMTRISIWVGRGPSRIVVYGIALYFVLAASAETSSAQLRP